MPNETWLSYRKRRQPLLNDTLNRFFNAFLPLGIQMMKHDNHQEGRDADNNLTHRHLASLSRGIQEPTMQLTHFAEERQTGRLCLTRLFDARLWHLTFTRFLSCL